MKLSTKFRLVSLEEFGKAFLPERIRPIIRKYLLKAGITDVPYSLFGLFFAITIILTSIVYIIYIYPTITSLGILLLFFLTFVSWIAIPLTLVAFSMAIIYTYLDSVISDRTRKIELVLDDYLMLVSENLKGGMGLDRALWESVKPEFGVLSREIEMASKKVATGEDIDIALGEFIEKYESPMTRRAFQLIIEEVRAGGQIALTMDKVVDDIKETKLIKADIVATNMQYVIFITSIVLVVSPLLFSLSYQLLTILVRFSTRIAPTLQTSVMTMPFNIGEVSLNLSDFVTFSRLSISMVAFFSSLIISQINRGNIKSGIKYLPLFIAGALLIYQFFMTVLSSVFSTLSF
jgi:Flp pilus assembly protein TadB